MHSPYVDFCLSDKAGRGYPEQGSWHAEGGERCGEATMWGQRLGWLCKTSEKRLHGAGAGSVAVQAFRIYTGLRDFGNLVKWVDSKVKPTGQRIALLASNKSILEGEQVEDIGVEGGQMFEGELFDQDSWDS